MTCQLISWHSVPSKAAQTPPADPIGKNLLLAPLCGDKPFNHSLPSSAPIQGDSQDAQILAWTPRKESSLDDRKNNPGRNPYPGGGEQVCHRSARNHQRGDCFLSQATGRNFPRDRGRLPGHLGPWSRCLDGSGSDRWPPPRGGGPDDRRQSVARQFVCLVRPRRSRSKDGCTGSPVPLRSGSLSARRRVGAWS